MRSLEGRLDDAAVYTTNQGEPFTYRQCAKLAYLIYVRFGRSLGAACLAWERMLQNNTELADFGELVRYGMQEEDTHDSGSEVRAGQLQTDSVAE